MPRSSQIPPVGGIEIQRFGIVGDGLHSASRRHLRLTTQTPPHCVGLEFVGFIVTGDRFVEFARDHARRRPGSARP